MHSIQDRFDFVQKRPTGFDYLRLFLALSVVAWHSVRISGGEESGYLLGPMRPLVFFILPSFFALSGFLVAGSLDRNKLPAFLTLRAVRIFPALAVEVLISALVIGPLLTTLPLSEYFASPVFHVYFLNVLGIIHFYLPGVFGDVPWRDIVNLQLWTIPWELYCYITLTVLAVVTIARRPAWLFAFAVAATLFWTAQQVFYIGQFHYNVANRPPGPMLVLAFLFGASLYGLRKHIPYSVTLLLVVMVVGWALIMTESCVYFAALPIAYTTVFLGLQNPPKSHFLKGADYSYGVYLYAFPLQQAIAHLFPAHRSWSVVFLGGSALALVCAYFSWTFLESRIMERRGIAVAFATSLSERLGALLTRSVLEPLRLVAQRPSPTPGLSADDPQREPSRAE